MFLKKGVEWYNPYFTEIQGKTYELKNIHFFSNSGVIISTSHGWFDAGNNTIGDVNIEIGCVRKLKPDFNLKTAFTIPAKKDWYDKKPNYPKVELFLPIGLFVWNKFENSEVNDYPTKKCFYDVFTILINNKTIKIPVFNHEEPNTENIEFIKRVKPILEQLGIELDDYDIVKKRKDIERLIKIPPTGIKTGKTIDEVLGNSFKI